MGKIKDRFTLGVVAGIIGNLAKTAVDEISLYRKISQRSYRSTAAGIFVSGKTEAEGLKGQLLGGIYDFGIAALGGIGMTYMLALTGTDKMWLKGTVSGIAFGSIISGITSMQSMNKISPKDAASNLSYLVSHGIYGMVAGIVIKQLGDPSLFNAKPINYPYTPRKYTFKQIPKRKIPIGEKIENDI